MGLFFCGSSFSVVFVVLHVLPSVFSGVIDLRRVLALSTTSLNFDI